MPVCHRCLKLSTSAEMRRTTKGHVCLDYNGCRHRVTVRKREELARHLPIAKLALVQRSYMQLERLRLKLGPVWEADALTGVRDAHENLDKYLGREADDDDYKEAS